MGSCSVNLTKDKETVIKLVNKMEFFMFRAMERKGLDFTQVVGDFNKDTISQLLLDVKNNIIPEYINTYKQFSAEFAQEGDNESAEDHKDFAVNLEKLLTFYDELIPNFFLFSNVFKTKTKYKINEDGLIDASDTEEDENNLSKMVFDRPANETNPVDDISKSVELFLRSLHSTQANDEYGFTINYDYAGLSRRLVALLENTINLDEIIRRLNENSKENPEYKLIAEKLTHREQNSIQETKFRVAFRNSFVKAFVPINMVSIEDRNTIKVFEASKSSISGYESDIQNNFELFGMPIINQDGESINLATETEDGSWIMTKQNAQGLKDLIKNVPDDLYKEMHIRFLEALGFSLSEETKEAILNDPAFLGEKGKRKGYINYIYDDFIKMVEYEKDGITNVIKKLKSGSYQYDAVNKKSIPVVPNHSGNLNKIIELELANNSTFNIDKSVINANGDRVFAIQLHNNFTIVNKILSDPIEYPTLQDILDKEPSLFWLDPEKNVSIKHDYLLNSLFYLDPLNKETYGQRRRVVNKKNYSLVEGEFAKIVINNTGGVQTKFEDTQMKREAGKSTSLNDIEKLLQDINSFMVMGYNSMLRLGDKSTDLGIMMNFYFNPVTGQPQRRPLSEALNFDYIFSNKEFLTPVINSLKDFAELKYLAKRGFLSKFSSSQKNILNSWGVFDKLISKETKNNLEKELDEATSIDIVTITIDKYNQIIEKEIQQYFKEYSKDFYNQFKPTIGLKDKIGLSVKTLLGSGTNNSLSSTVNFYLANSFLTDLSQMNLFFGNAVFFKDFHKRASKDSATGIFTFMEKDTIEDFNDHRGGIGANTNLAGRMLIEKLFEQKKITKEERDEALSRQRVGKTFKSGVIKDVSLRSREGGQDGNIHKNIALLKEEGFISPEMEKLYDENLRGVIDKGYGQEDDFVTEADGQGKCTFDFYRTMVLDTNPEQWTEKHEEQYNKIIMYNHYDELADEEIDPIKKAEYIQKRDAVKYNPLEDVYFPPKKFQYSGPQQYTEVIDGKEYVMQVPVFDKFSLQPLIPTIIKNTADAHLAKKMAYNGVGYVKMKSGSKVETPKDQDDYFFDFDPNNPEVRIVQEFNPSFRFKSEQTLFMSHLKEQVEISPEIHESTIFGSQIRKLIMMNLSRPEFKTLHDRYKRYIDELTELEKTKLYNELGIIRTNGKLKVNNFPKLIDYFFKEIDKKGQNINVKKALKYNETTKQFEIPLDASVQAQVLEGIIISAINNKVVKYKTNGSMLTQVAVTGSEINKFNQELSEKALSLFGNDGLKYYDVIKDNGKTKVTRMQVKIGLTGQWLKLLKLNHPDGRPIETLERLNDAIKNEQFQKTHSKSLTMVSYRIPTQGRNFTDVMEIAEFLPSAFGDAIIMPTEAIVKSGSDFDIDKMFVFYSNLKKDGYYNDAFYDKKELEDPEQYDRLKAAIQNRLYETMQEVILHPANYMELVTPAENYHILPIINRIYTKLELLVNGEREKTDYKNSDILNRQLNIKKFLSLLKGKSDLGIAAKANVLNVLFQLSKAKVNSSFLSTKSITTFFRHKNFTIKGFNNLESADLSDIFDEKGILKSEFFSEFINAFVDVARDDYVFTANVVTELSPVLFYMKNLGLSTEKILFFANQPAIRTYIKNLSKYQNKFLAGSLGINPQVRQKALQETLADLGYFYINNQGEYRQNRFAISEYLKNSQQVLHTYFTEEQLEKNIIPDNKLDLSKLSDQEKTVQIAMLLEFENLKLQATELSDIQKVLDFDTNMYSSSYEVYQKEQKYKDGMNGNSILDPSTIDYIKNKSIISSLDVGKDIKQLLEEVFPLRNSEQLNQFLSDFIEQLRSAENPIIKTDDDALKVARTFKNDLSNFVLQNFIEKSAEGSRFFREEFNTDKNFNEYMEELITSSKLSDMYKELKKSDIYKELVAEFPFIKNITKITNQRNKKLSTFKIVMNSTNVDEKDKVISQFQRLVNLTNPEHKFIKDFFKNLALYSTFQSGMNTSEFSFIDIVPVNLVNKLYGESFKEFNKLSEKDKKEIYYKLKALFAKNNAPLFGANTTSSLTNETPSKGKWYIEKLLDWSTKTPKTESVTSTVGETSIKDFSNYKDSKDEFLQDPNNNVWTMRWNQDVAAFVDKNENFGNPWVPEELAKDKTTGEIRNYMGIIVPGKNGEGIAARNYYDWLTTEKYDDDPTLFSRKQWILRQIDNGYFNGKTLIYYKPGVYRSHADALFKVIQLRTKEKISLESTDRIVFGHPTIGKSFLKNKGENRFISLDDDYSTEIINKVKEIADKYNVTTYQVKDGGNQNWNIEYDKMMQEIFNIAKQRAISENKTLFTSNTNLLKNNAESFDKVINLTNEEFERRIKERGTKYDIKNWKSQINEVISKIPQNKVINTDKYLSDLINITQKPKEIDLTPKQKYTVQYNTSKIEEGSYLYINRKNNLPLEYKVIKVSNEGILVKNLETNKEKLFNEEEYRETFNVPKDSGFVVLGEFGLAEVDKYTKLENNKPVYSLNINLYEDQFKGKGLGKDIYLKVLEEVEKLGGVLTPGNVVEGNKIWESFRRDGLLSEAKTKEGEIITIFKKPSFYQQSIKTEETSKFEQTTPAEHTSYSGAAAGADKTFEAENNKLGIKHVNFTVATLNRLKTEQPQNYLEALNAYKVAANALKRPFLDPDQADKPNPTEKEIKDAYAGKLMTRDYLQSKAGDAVFAISDILYPGEYGKPSSKGIKNYNKTNKQVVDGGTGYAVEMGIQLGKTVYVFHQGTDPNHVTKVGWYKWNGKEFVPIETPKLTKKFAGVGTRHLNEAGKKAISDLYKNTFKKEPISEINSNLADSINKMRSEMPWKIDMSNGQIEEMYNKEKLSGESIEEFMDRMLCNGKIK